MEPDNSGGSGGVFTGGAAGYGTRGHDGAGIVVTGGGTGGTGAVIYGAPAMRIHGEVEQCLPLGWHYDPLSGFVGGMLTCAMGAALLLRRRA